MGAGKASVATHVRLIKLSVAEVVDVNTREEGVTVKKNIDHNCNSRDGCLLNY